MGCPSCGLDEMWQRLRVSWRRRRRWWLTGGVVLLLGLCASAGVIGVLWPAPASIAKERMVVCVDPEWTARGPGVLVVVWANPAGPVYLDMGALGGCLQLSYRPWFIPPSGSLSWEWP
jgi:hypothetical protein